MKLHQLLAILPSVKSASAKAKTELYQLIQKGQVFKGISRTYSPREEDGYVYPPESSPVQVNAESIVRDFATACGELFDMAAAQDQTNRYATASIEINGQVIATDIPVTHLLFLEKQITDVRTFFSQLPVLDPDKRWEYDSNRGCYITEPRLSVKTKKITKPVVLYEATKEHPAQVREVSEDIAEGTWTTIDLSGGLPRDTIQTLLRKTDALLKAIIVAREKANAIEVTPCPAALAIFDYLLESL